MARLTQRLQVLHYIFSAQRDRSDVVCIEGRSIEVRNPTNRFEDVRPSVPPQIPTHASIMSQCRPDDSYNLVGVKTALSTNSKIAFMHCLTGCNRKSFAHKKFQKLERRFTYH